VTDSQQTETVVREAFALENGLDVVVNNAGYGLLGAVEEADDAEIAAIFDVHFFGALRVIRAALPLMRAQGSGHIVNISSIAGLDPLAGSGFYAAAKCAMTGMSMSLAAEVRPLGITVMLVELGAFRTDFLSEHSIRFTARTIDDYAATAGATRQLGSGGGQPGEPAKAAAVIIDAVEDADPPAHLVLGADAVARARASAQRLLADIDRWERVSRKTAYDDVLLG
jgi:NAD(P)-dependent dehydrogenase (short-subunit alcohol dehydrogenase family)